MHLRRAGAVVDAVQPEGPAMRALPIEDDDLTTSGEHLHGDQLGKHALDRTRAGADRDVRGVVPQGQDHRLVPGTLP